MMHGSELLFALTGHTLATITKTMKVERLAIGSIQLDPENVRSHPSKNMDAICRSLERFGQQKPIVIDSAGVVVAGNGTLAAARRLGWTTINAIRTELRGAAARAFSVADNRCGELSDWGDGLGDLLIGLESDGFAADQLGFTDNDLNDLLLNVEPIDAEQAFGGLPAGEREPFQQMSFIVRDEDVDTIKRAIGLARRDVSADGNQNGLALGVICGEYLGTRKAG
jgi:hypothetical protein